MVTYTTDNVSGLDISSPVRYRGVPLGRVSGIRADPVGNTIEITFEVYRDRLATIGANVTLFETYAAEAVFPKMRAQVIGNPVTGEAYLLLDVPRNPPPPMALKFNPTKPYVASMPSPLSTVRDRLPEVLDRAEATLQTLREIVGRIPASLDRSDQFFTNVERIVRESQLPVLSAESRKFFATRARRSNSSRPTWTGWSVLREHWSSSSTMRTPQSTRQTFPRRPGRREVRWNIPASRPTISGALCQPSGTLSTSCASSRGCSMSSRSRLSMANDRHGYLRDEWRAAIVVLAPRHDCVSGWTGLPAAAPRHSARSDDRTAARPATGAGGRPPRMPRLSDCSRRRHADTSAGAFFTSFRTANWPRTPSGDGRPPPIATWTRRCASSWSRAPICVSSIPAPRSPSRSRSWLGTSSRVAAHAWWARSRSGLRRPSAWFTPASSDSASPCRRDSPATWLSPRADS
jgi:hypothetical protein